VVIAIDGDTVKLDVQIWIDLIQRFSLHLYGVNATEKKDNGVPKCEKKHGQESASLL